MSKTQRVLTSKQLPFDVAFPTIEGKCAYCQKPLKGKQRRWCGDQCSRDAWRDVNLRRGVSTYVRIALKKRDQEICAECKADCGKLKRIYNAALRAIWHRWPDYSHIVEHIQKLLGYGPGGTFWQGDHIREVAAGGEHSLDNLQTLCTKCHKDKTRRFLQK